jgi:hypothetical protein
MLWYPKIELEPDSKEVLSNDAPVLPRELGALAIVV